MSIQNDIYCYPVWLIAGGLAFHSELFQDQLADAGGVLGLLPRHTARPVLNPGIVLRPLEGISTRRRIDILARPENLKRRSVMIVCEALQAIMTGLVEQG
jgi:hypothetical protein